MKIPYGLADYRRLRQESYVYVDRTSYLRTLENLGFAHLFLRPRRFGKSLWLKTLACYYDLRLAAEHEQLFGDLSIGREPTELAHRYFVLEWDFSAIDPDPPLPEGVNGPAARARRIGALLDSYLNGTFEAFLVRYREQLPEPVALGDDPVRNLTLVLAAIERTPYRLLLLIDEYDNFANEVMVSDAATYGELVHAGGPLKRVFKWIKASLQGRGLERLLITGVSPVAMADLTSALNVTENVSLYAELNALCGFTAAEVRELLERLRAEAAASSQPAWSLEEALGMLRTWYDGYRFAIEAEEPVYNPTLVLYFLKHLDRTGAYPRQMLDTNLAADEEKLRHLGRVASGKRMIFEALAQDGVLEVSQIEERFTLSTLRQIEASEEAFPESLLYFFGMLTLAGETERRTLRLVVPNLVVRGLYLGEVARLLASEATERDVLRGPARSLLETGEIEPLLEFLEREVLPTFSNRDYRWANELTLRTVFLAFLFDPHSYTVSVEPELGRRYADLVLLRRPDARGTRLFDLLLELKYVRLADLGLSGEQLRGLSRAELEALAPVGAAFREAEAQLHELRRSLVERHGTGLRLRAFAVVALGFERLVARVVQ